jgi:collagenase-like PrtC family protease
MKKRLKINISNLKVKGKYREYAYMARLAKEWDTLKNAAGRQQNLHRPHKGRIQERA